MPRRRWLNGSVGGTLRNRVDADPTDGSDHDCDDCRSRHGAQRGEHVGEVTDREWIRDQNGSRRKREADEKLTLLVAGVPGLRLADPLAIGELRPGALPENSDTTR